MSRSVSVMEGTLFCYTYALARFLCQFIERLIAPSGISMP